MNKRLYFLMTVLLVVTALFTSRVVADLAESQQAYDTARNQYNDLRVEYNEVIEKYDSVSVSGDITQVESLQYDFWEVQSTAKHFVSYNLMYAAQAQSSSDPQEQTLRTEFLALGHLFAQVQEDSSAKINELEPIRFQLQLWQDYQILAGQIDTAKTKGLLLNHDIGNAMAVPGNTVKVLELKEMLLLQEAVVKTLKTSASNVNHKAIAIKDTALQKKLTNLVDAMDAELKTITEVKVSLDSYISIVNNNPVLISIGNKSITIGGTLSFTVSASDADNDTLQFTMENKPTTATFDNKVFSWTPTASEAGIYTVTFKVADGKGGEAKEAVKITVSANTPLTKLQEAQQKFNNYQDKFESYKDDYLSYKKNYDNAVKNNDYSDVKKYTQELNGLDDEVKDLINDLKDLKDEADSLTDGDVLYDDVKDLQKDAEMLQTKIKKIFDGEQVKESTSQASMTSNVKPSIEKQVEVQKLSTMPGEGVAREDVQDVNNSNDLRAKALLIGGIVILMAVIVFLMAVVMF
ncbi:Ig-like domain-containing protein [Candidatus Woesearchaeota archaeon]|nr:Ig-like domain-containing protein [Candidatus Woesearchaeota archaeon]